MAPRPPLLLRSLAFAAALAAPAAALLILFALSGALDPSLALIGAIAVFLGLLAPAFAHVRGLSGLAERLRGGQGPIAGMTVLPELDRAAREAVDRAQGRIEALEASLAGAESVFASLPDPLIMLNSEQRVIRANRAAETLLQEPLAGRALPGLLRHPALMAAVESALAEGVGHKVEIALSVPVERELIAHVEPLARPLPEGAAAILVLHDVTAMMRSDRMRADFIANASHELRTPLSTLIGFLETLAGPARNDPGAQARFLPIMLEQGRRMARLVSDLLSLSRIELNEHTPPSGSVDLAPILKSVAESLALKASGRDMAIRLELGPMEPVIGDAEELTQVFQNLIDNAIKYGSAGAEVRVLAGPADAASPRVPRRLAGGVAVSVIDRGEGIQREHLPRLTERFYRVDSARSRELGGTGLGLAIVKHILNRHRGHLEIESVLKEGSRFTVYLRTAQAGQAPLPR
jgi:two-component system, OmpR family, phosphate regulon sensor histidine kinase PhoR